jgi:hypothetical protein
MIERLLYGEQNEEDLDHAEIDCTWDDREYHERIATAPTSLPQLI